MTTTHDVEIYKIETYRGSKRTTYRVRWRVGHKKPGETFDTFGLAESFRAQLVSAMARGEAFDIQSGLPVSMLRTASKRMSWLDLICDFMDARWLDWSPNHRKHTARSLMNVTLAMFATETDRPEVEVLRKALITLLNRTTRDADHSIDVANAVAWCRRNSRQVADLTDPEVLRPLLQSLERNLDGKPAATNTVRLRRLALKGAIDFAIESKLLDTNPLDVVKLKKRTQAIKQVDPRSVVNPMQARMLIDAVPHVGKPGPPLKAFFGCLYYAALRPEEALNLRKSNLAIPECGWGDLYLEKARPEIGDTWTDSGTASEERALKHRDDGDGRMVPCPPELTELLHEHLTAFGVSRDGRLFRGARDGGRVGSTTYGRVWSDARELVFTPEIAAGPLGKRPYDLRHAAVSAWLNGGVEPPRVAKWAGHSLRVLLEVYAKCLDGGERAARDRVERALRGW